MKRSSCLLALLWPVLNSCAQQTGTKPLTIGDTIPHIILTDVVNFPVSEIQLSSQQHKLIIIDFWGRYCAPCLKALPTYDRLQQAFQDSIRIITVSDFASAKEFTAAKQRFSFLQNMHLPVLLQNNPLTPLFPHKLLSHIVWIAPGGVVKAITGAEQLTASNIRRLLANETVHWPVKRDIVDFDYRKPLLTIAQPVEPPTHLYYSSFSSFINGIAPPSGTETDQSTGISFTAFYNHDLFALIQLALDYRTDAPKDQFQLLVKDSSRFICPDPSQLKLWQAQNSWCYYLRLPANVSRERTRHIVQADLLRWLNIMGYEVSRQTTPQGKQYVIKDLQN